MVKENRPTDRGPELLYAMQGNLRNHDRECNENSTKQLTGLMWKGSYGTYNKQFFVFLRRQQSGKA